jgi:transcriptional regulator with XRE-family HTH domain
MGQKQTDGYSGRISVAMREGPRPMTVRQLARVLGEHPKHKNIRGVSYGGVRQYVEGGIRNPRAELLRAIADVLGVRWQWLAHNEGFMTAAQQQERASAVLRDPEQVRHTVSAVNVAVFEQMPALRPVFVFGMDQLVLACVPEVANWIGPTGLDLPGLEDAPDEQEGHRRHVEAARLLGRALAAPLETLQLDPAGWPQAVKAQYVAGLMASLMPLLDLAATKAAAMNEERRAQGE